MSEVSTTVKLKVAKEILAKVFIDATSSSITEGIIFKYKSYPVEIDENNSGWVFDLIYKEPASPERILQQFTFKRPSNIDAKNMEWHVIISVLTEMLRNSATMWDKLGKLLNTDISLQETVKKSKANDN